MMALRYNRFFSTVIFTEVILKKEFISLIADMITHNRSPHLVDF